MTFTISFPAWLAHCPFLSVLGIMPLVHVQSIPISRKLIQKKRLLPPDVWRIWPKWHFVVQLFSVLRRCPPRSPRSPMPILKPQLGRDVEEFTWDRSKPIFCNLKIWNTLEEMYMNTWNIYENWWKWCRKLHNTTFAPILLVNDCPEVFVLEGSATVGPEVPCFIAKTFANAESLNMVSKDDDITHGKITLIHWYDIIIYSACIYTYTYHCICMCIYYTLVTIN